MSKASRERQKAREAAGEVRPQMNGTETRRARRLVWTMMHRPGWAMAQDGTVYQVLPSGHFLRDDGVRRERRERQGRG